MQRSGLDVSKVTLLLLTGLLLPAFASPGVAAEPDRYREQRLRMVDQELAREGIKNERVLTAMRHVPRHLFVRPELRRAAYYDQALPIGHKQTISPPFIVAYMTEVIDPQPEERVLEIGTGSGYQAAVLSGLAKDVYTIEIVEELGRKAAKLLHDLEYDNVHPRVGDGYKGWAEHAPFDKIIVTCSPEDVPKPLIDQLREGGKMIIPLGERYDQVFYLYEKQEGKLVRQKLLPAQFVPMTGISEEQRKVKPDPAHPEIQNGGFEIDADKDGNADSWYYQRQVTLERTEAPEGDAFLTFRNTEPSRGAHVLQGMGIDGGQVSALTVSLQVRGENLKSGTHPYETPAFVIIFYDADRRPVASESLGPWRGSFRWKTVSKTLHVPPKAKEAILRMGLNGGTGELSVDDLKVRPQPR